MPKPGQRDWFATGMKALFVAATLFGAFYLRSMVLIPPADLAAAINAANFDRIKEEMRETEVEEIFGVKGILVVDPEWLKDVGAVPGFEGVQWFKWSDPTARERWIAVGFRTWAREGKPLEPTSVVAKRKNGF
jgi:hypothetical protein